MPNGKHEVALTFDDGPGKDTQKVLEILREHDVKATFFVVGRRGWKHDDDLRAMVAEGHEVGNHTWSHPEPGEISESALAKQFERNQKISPRPPAARRSSLVPGAASTPTRRWRT